MWRRARFVPSRRRARSHRDASSTAPEGPGRRSSVRFLTDVLLDLVEHDQQAGQFPFLPPKTCLIFSIMSSTEMSSTLGNCFCKRIRHRRVCRRSRGRPPGSRWQWRRRRRGWSARSRSHTGALHMIPDGLFQALVTKPEQEARPGKLRRQTDRPEQDAQQCETDAVARAEPERAGGRMKPTFSFRLGGKLDQELFDRFGTLTRPRARAPSGNS